MLQGKVSSTLLPYFSSPKTGLNHGLSASKLSKPTKLIILCHQQVWAAWSFHQGLSSIAGSSPLTNSWNFHEFSLALAMHPVYRPTCHQQPVCISTKTLKWQWFSLWISRPNRTYVLTPCWPWVNSMVRNNPQFWSASHRSSQICAQPGPSIACRWYGHSCPSWSLRWSGIGLHGFDMIWPEILGYPDLMIQIGQKRFGKWWCTDGFRGAPCCWIWPIPRFWVWSKSLNHPWVSKVGSASCRHPSIADRLLPDQARLAFPIGAGNP